MKYRIENPKPTETKTHEEADQLFHAGSIVGYKVSAYYGILTRLDDQKYGFVVVGGSDRKTPTFISSNSIECIRLAAGANNSGRILFVVDRLGELDPH